MCGIIGIILRTGKVAPLLLDGLQRLEYRGYDSAGLAVINQNKLIVKKHVGSIQSFQKCKDISKINGRTGIAHTRWATHGSPTLNNAHPHTDCTKSIAIVHNGIIENADELKEELIARNHKFKSQTDSEVIAHLIEEYTTKERNLLKALVRTLRRLKGSYAIALISTFEPDRILCARNQSPLIVGINDNVGVCASDPLTLIPYTKKIIPLEDGQIAEIKPGKLTIYKPKGRRVIRINPKSMLINWSPRIAKKGGYEYYTLKEIHEQPQALLNSLGIPSKLMKRAIDLLLSSERIFIIACGSSYHAALTGSYYLDKISGISSTPVIASVFNDIKPKIDENSLVIAISQSGETADTLLAVRYALSKGAKVLAITNILGSTLDRISSSRLYIYAGPEIGVAATKTYTNQISILYQLSIKAGLANHNINKNMERKLTSSLSILPKKVEETINNIEQEIMFLAKILRNRNSMFYLGRGLHMATAYEGALKMKELSYIHAEAYPAGESKHGPIALVHKDFPVVFIGTRDDTKEKLISNMMEMKARNALVIAVSDDDDILSKAQIKIKVPKVHPFLAPIVQIVPLQLLAYYTALERGYNPDKPRNLAKSVTVN